MQKKWPLGDRELKLGMMGMTEGNGHPYSWSAIFNGYDRDEMATCGFPVIPVYLAQQPESTFGIPGARVTHVYCNQRSDAEHVARAALIPNVVDRPEDMLGEVDAVVCATDVGAEHVERCRPFIENDIPVFIDKPLVDNVEDLRTFIAWHEAGKHFLSSSSLRYQKDLEPYYKNRYELGQLVFIARTMQKYWTTYGMHALESLYPLLGEGFRSIQDVGPDPAAGKHHMLIKHDSGCTISLVQQYFISSPGLLLCGTDASIVLNGGDTYYSFKKQMEVFVEYIRTGIEPYPFRETVVLAQLLIGGLISGREGGREVLLSEIV